LLADLDVTEDGLLDQGEFYTALQYYMSMDAMKGHTIALGVDPELLSEELMANGKPRPKAHYLMPGCSWLGYGLEASNYDSSILSRSQSPFDRSECGSPTFHPNGTNSMPGRSGSPASRTFGSVRSFTTSPKATSSGSRSSPALLRTSPFPHATSPSLYSTFSEDQVTNHGRALKLPSLPIGNLTMPESMTPKLDATRRRMWQILEVPESRMEKVWRDNDLPHASPLSQTI
jgi:hypothetical protein